MMLNITTKPFQFPYFLLILVIWQVAISDLLLKLRHIFRRVA